MATRRVIFAKDVKGFFPNGKRDYQAGQTYEVDAIEARLWIKRGVAREAPAEGDRGIELQPQTCSQPEPVERATAGPTETAGKVGTAPKRPRTRRRRQGSSI